MTQVTGLGAEEISRIVQVGDDWGVEMGTIRSALQMMNRKGITPSVENLAILADEYVTATDKSKFMEEATKKYGRSVVELIPILAKGGQSLRDQTAAIDENMLATEESIKASREYEVAVDDLQDTFQGLKYELGNAVIPVLTDLLKATSELKTSYDTFAEAEKKLRIAFDAGVISGKEHIAMTLEMQFGQKTATEILLELADANKEVFDAATMAYPEEEKYIGLYADLKKGADDYTESINNTAIALYELDQQAMAKAGIDALNKAWVDGKIAEDEYRKQMVMLMDKMLLMDDQAIVTTLKMADLKKQLDDGELNASQYATAIRNLYNDLKTLDGTEANTYINEYRTYYEEYVVGTGDGRRAEGGPVGAGHSYMVGERGPEMFVPSASGMILPNSMMSNYSVSTNNNRNVSINMGGVNISNGADHQAFISKVEWAVQRALGV
jgi:uncharacterized coiled-coil protein SlyX